MRIEEHIRKLRSIDGTRPYFFEEWQIPEGWVIAADADRTVWKSCNESLNSLPIPLRARKLLLFLQTKATQQMAEWIKEFGSCIIVVCIADEESPTRVNWGPILVSDLEKSYEMLMDEAIALANVYNELSKMKERCSMIVKK